MQRFDGGRLFISITGLSNLGHSIPFGQNSLAIPESNFNDIKEKIEYICSELECIDLSASLVTARTIRDILNSEIEIKENLPVSMGERLAFFSPMVLSKYQNYTKDIVTRFKDELSARMVFTIQSGKSNDDESPTPLFGEDVFNAFPSANDDIAEAGACLALGRGTACVMHLMRASEVGLSALAKALGIGKKNDWGSYLREIDKELSVRAKASGARSADEQFYSEAATSFDHVKRAWRNPTMHVDRSYSKIEQRKFFSQSGPLCAICLPV